MRGFNKVILMGHVVRDLEVRYTASGTPVAEFTVAVNRVYVKDGNKKEEVAFVSIVVWQKLAENCAQYLHKGSPVLVEGRIIQNNYEDKEGKKQSRTKVQAEAVQFLGKRDENATEASAPDEHAEEWPADEWVNDETAQA